LAHTIAANDRDAARRFFEGAFTPLLVHLGDQIDGLFTGYYEPELKGSRTPDDRFRVPILARPADLLTADLGLFNHRLKRKSIACRVKATAFIPYADRHEIEGKIAAQSDVALAPDPNLTPVVYVDDPVAAFFMEIQGSGRISLADGSVIRVGYAAQNGRPYTP